MCVLKSGTGTLFLVFSALILNGCVDKNGGMDSPPVEEPYESRFLDQGWDNNQRLDFYNTSQGSQLIPYSWFLALEQFDSDRLFRDKENIQRLGYIPQKPNPGINPDGLPIGFVKNDNIEPILSSKISTLRLYARAGNDQPGYQTWLGLTCAACHTSEIVCGKNRLRIDGGPPLSDFQAFIESLAKALEATTLDDDKLTRFAKRIIPEGGYNETEKQRLKTEVVQFGEWLDNYIEMNYAGLTAPYGYGRLDAFGAILNRVTAEYTRIQANAVPANAPTSYPFLWDTSQLSWVQWNGSANSPIGRNVGEVLGVFAHTSLNTDDPRELFLSSANLLNLERLEKLMGGLQSPNWKPPLPPIDQNKAARGKALYAEHCVVCHGIRDENGKFPMTAANQYGAQFIEINMIPLEKIGTDPLMAMNFVNPAFDVDPGIMRNHLPESARDKPKVPRALMLSTLVKGVIGRQVAELNPPDPDRWLLELSGFHLPQDKGGPAPPNLVAYKARPLNGVWATAPFLHNGSVSSLYQLLLPDSERERAFYVGSKEFDAKNVGFESSPDGNAFLFETLDGQGSPIPGNSNRGHSGRLYTQTKGDDGQWRNFTDDERYQLIEYLKTL